MKNKVKINNRLHGYFYIKNGDDLPIILYLHGGPGSPEYPIFQSKLPKEYLKNFNIIYYDHMGCGLSYSKGEDDTIDSLVEDVKSITEFIISTYKVDKLILMGHSFGSFIGLQAAEKFPHLFYFYVGISQVIDVKKSEEMIYRGLIKVCSKQKDFKCVEALEIERKKGDFPSSNYLSNVKGKIISKYHIGLMRKDVSKHFIFEGLVNFKEYSFKEKMNYVKGLVNSSKLFLPQLLQYPSLMNHRHFSIPIYFVHGKYDYQVAKELVIDLYEKIQAPKKSFCIFNNSAHFPNIEESRKFDYLISEFTNENI